MSSSKFILILSGLMASIAVYSQGLPDSIAVYEMDSTVVSSTIRTNGIKGDVAKGLSIKMSSLATFPKMLGAADPLKFAQSLPGVTTNSEWESGLKIQGCEASQSIIELCDVPVFNQGRILGLFSVFNPGHFKKIRFSTSTTARRIGGELGLDTDDTLSHALNGEANLGPVSAYATLAFPTGRKSSLTISGRRSFIDVFYKGLLKMDGSELNYKFYDINASYLYVPDKYNTVDVNAYFGLDDGYVNADSSGGNMGGEWSSAVANIRWRHHKDDLNISTQAYVSTYFMSGNLALAANAGRAEDYIVDAAIHSTAMWRGWEFAAEADYYDIQPQNIFDLSSTNPKTDLLPKQQSVLATLRSSYRFLASDFMLKPSLAVSLYSDISDKNLFPRIDPEISAEYNFYRGGRLNLDFGYKHQYLFMTGLTDSGFPVEFWLGCGKYSKPQASLFSTLSYNIDLPDDAFSINFQTYGKRIWNIVEYSGYMSELLGGCYNLQNMLLTGDGYNYGITAQVQKNSGKFTGWISYSWTRALRRFDNPDFPYIYPSTHEREHEFKAVASYLTGRWEFGGNFIFTSGLPYTPVSSAFFLNQSLLVKYGERNSKRLSPYIRLDISASFNIRRTGRFRDGINISVQNVTARDNQMTAMLKVKDGKYSYAPTKLIIPVMPSINYYCRF